MQEIMKEVIIETVRGVARHHLEFDMEFSPRVWLVGIEWQFRVRGWDILIHPLPMITFWITDNY